jgi:hypothetical protein
VTFGPEQFVPYILLGILFVVLILNVISSDGRQRDIRSVLLLSTLAVVGLVVLRQILTQLENERLARRQADALERLEAANRHVEDQARMIAERNATLEGGMAHLKDVQARLANGNLRARARLAGGELLPLAASLNLMADRLMRLEQTDVYSQRLGRALAELSLAIERYRNGAPFIAPLSCYDFAEINHLLLAMGLKERVDTRSAKPVIPAGSISSSVQSSIAYPQTNRQQQYRNSQYPPPTRKMWSEAPKRSDAESFARQDPK